MAGDRVTEERTICGAGALIAADVVFRGRAVPAIDFGCVTRGSWSEFDLSRPVTRLDVDVGGSLVVRATECALPPAKIATNTEPGGSPFELELSTGFVSAPYASMREARFSSPNGKLTLDLDSWRWESRRAPAVIWIGSLRGAYIRRGNLTMQRHESDNRELHHGHVFEGGGMRWLIVPSGATPEERRRATTVLCIVEVTDGTVDLARIRAGLHSASFVLGCRLGLDVLVGVDGAGEAVSAIGVGAPGRGRDHRIRCPGLFTNLSDQGWAAEFFRLLANAKATDPDGDNTYLATESYIDAMTPDVDRGYLQAQVALEAFCTRVTAGSGDPPLVGDLDAWARWVADNEPAIRAHAAGTESADSLVGKVRSAGRSSSGRRVQRFFTAHGVTLPKSVTKEIGQRARAAHDLEMSRHRHRNVDDDVARVALIQTLLAAAVALHVGYRGPVGSGTYALDPLDWWPYPPGPSPRPSRFVYDDTGSIDSVSL